VNFQHLKKGTNTCLSLLVTSKIGLQDSPLKPLSLAYTRKKWKKFALRRPFTVVKNDLSGCLLTVKITLMPEVLTQIFPLKKMSKMTTRFASL
jgi:hypothetical protein